MSIAETADFLYNKKVEELKSNRDRLLYNLDKYKNGPNSEYHKKTIDDVFLFVEKYFEWYMNSSELRQYLYEMFKNVICSEIDIFAQLLHFIGYYFYDDGYWNVKWFKNVVDIDTFIHTKVETTEDDWEDGYPVIVCEDVTQNPKIIVDAMTKFEENLKLRKRYYDENPL